jgi:hypothetical protein
MYASPKPTKYIAATQFGLSSRLAAVSDISPVTRKMHLEVTIIRRDLIHAQVLTRIDFETPTPVLATHPD